MATPILASATPFIALCALACPVGMGAMMWFMTRGSRSQPSQPPAQQPARVDEPRGEHDRLDTQVESPQDACAEAESRDGSAQGVTAAGARDTLGR